ncbi:MAG: hypothetical protein ACK5PC_04640 [Cyclobacteriaceae bacterium]
MALTFIHENKVLFNKDQNSYFRIYKVVANSGYIHLTYFKLNANKGDVKDVSIEDSKLPERYGLKIIERKLESGELVLLEVDPVQKNTPEINWTDAERNRIMRAWAKIEPIVTGDTLLYPTERFQLIKELSTEKPKASEPTIINWLKNYLVGGLLKSAICPNFSKCGGSGKPRNTRKMPAIIESIVIKGFEKFWFNSGRTIESVRLETKRQFYNKDIHGEWFPETPMFRRYAKKHFPNAFENKVKRLGRKNAMRTSRLKLGRTSDIANGPGDLFQIDWTSTEINLVASFNPSIHIGIPKLYVVIDSYSRLVVGILITMEDPCWTTFMNAIFNAARNKKRWAALYDYVLEEGEWLGECLCQCFIADGEADTLKANQLGTNTHISLAGCESYRGDLKGIVERIHLTVKSRIKSELDGSGATVERYGRRLGVDARKEACLTLKDLYHITIGVVLEYNKLTMKNYPNNSEILEYLVEKSPNGIWKWASENGYGGAQRRHEDETVLMMDLCAKEKITPDSNGFQINKHQFVPERSEHQALLQNLINQPNGAGKQLVWFDKNAFKNKFWIYNDQFIPLRKMGEDEQEYSNIWEMVAVNKYYDDEAKKKKQQEDDLKIATNLMIRRVHEEAKIRQGVDTVVSITNKTSAKELEIQLENKKQQESSLKIESQPTPEIYQDPYDEDSIFSMYSDQLNQIDTNSKKYAG